MEPNIKESIWSQYRNIVEANKEQRKYKGDWDDNEPTELIFDESCLNDTDEDGKPIDIPWDYSNLLSLQWVKDLFGMDEFLLFRLLPLKLVEVNGNMYVRESEVQGIMTILKALANSNFVNVLRPKPQITKDIAKAVYTSKDLMNLLNVKEATLRNYRNEGYLAYSQLGDKIWYTQENIDEFLNHPDIKKEAWRNNPNL